MKRMLLAAAFLAMMAVAGNAQGITPPDHHHGETLTIIGGSGGPGFTYSYGGGSYTLSGYRVYSPYRVGGWYSPFRTQWWHRPVYSPWSRGGYGYAPSYRPMDTAPPPSAVTPKMRGVADRQDEIAANLNVSKGIRLFKKGSYKEARDAFREAVVGEAGPRAEAFFALALAATDDAENADKALRSAAEHAPFGRVDLDELFEDAEARTRMISEAKGLTGAWLNALAGKSDPLKKLAEKDPLAKKLLKE